jgi:hypothetical protein
MQWDDGYETFCGRTIAAENLRVASPVKCYKGDECANCQESVEVWNWIKEQCPAFRLSSIGRAEADPHFDAMSVVNQAIGDDM